MGLDTEPRLCEKRASIGEDMRAMTDVRLASDAVRTTARGANSAHTRWHANMHFVLPEVSDP